MNPTPPSTTATKTSTTASTTSTTAIIPYSYNAPTNTTPTTSATTPTPTTPATTSTTPTTPTPTSTSASTTTISLFTEDGQQHIATIKSLMNPGVKISAKSAAVIATSHNDSY
jgi:hypothetical protein